MPDLVVMDPHQSVSDHMMRSHPHGTWADQISVNENIKSNLAL